MISSPSSESIVIIDTSESPLIGSHKSFLMPFTDTAKAALAKPGPISLAKSRPFEPSSNFLTLPSGNVIFIGGII